MVQREASTVERGARARATSAGGARRPRRRDRAPLERDRGGRQPDPRREARVRPGAGPARPDLAARSPTRPGAATSRSGFGDLARRGGALGGGPARRRRGLLALARRDAPAPARGAPPGAARPRRARPEPPRPVRRHGRRLHRGRRPLPRRARQGPAARDRLLPGASCTLPTSARTHRQTFFGLCAVAHAQATFPPWDPPAAGKPTDRRGAPRSRRARAPRRVQLPRRRSRRRRALLDARRRSCGRCGPRREVEFEMEQAAQIVEDGARPITSTRSSPRPPPPPRGRTGSAASPRTSRARRAGSTRSARSRGGSARARRGARRARSSSGSGPSTARSPRSGRAGSARRCTGRRWRAASSCSARRRGRTRRGSGARSRGPRGRRSSAGSSARPARTRRRSARAIYIAAVVRCFPGKTAGGGDRVPTADECALWRGFVAREVEILRPRLVIPVGRLAIQEVLGHTAPIAAVVGRAARTQFHGVDVDVIPLPHPSGASTWFKMEPGRTLLEEALALVAAHPEVVRAFAEARLSARRLAGRARPRASRPRLRARRRRPARRRRAERPRRRGRLGGEVGRRELLRRAVPRPRRPRAARATT